MRTLNELYKILYNEIKDKNYIGGICHEIRFLKYNEINSIESKTLYDHFLTQRYKHPEFMTKERNWNKPSNSYWWNDNEDSNPVNRKAFVKKLSEMNFNN